MRTIRIIFSLLILNFSFLIPSAHSQFLQGIGITLGGTIANQKWKDEVLGTTERKKFVPGFNGSIFAEFIDNENIRWDSEFQFNQKGYHDKVNDSTSYNTRLNYISWNNFLKYRYELVSITPYVFAGPQLEYTLSQSEPNPRVTGNYKKLHVSLGLGAGVELVTMGHWKPFIEAIYNPDISKAHDVAGMKNWNRAYELRIGIRYSLKKGKKDMDCNAPIYVPDF